MHIHAGSSHNRNPNRVNAYLCLNVSTDFDVHSSSRFLFIARTVRRECTHKLTDANATDHRTRASTYLVGGILRRREECDLQAFCLSTNETSWSPRYDGRPPALHVPSSENNIESDRRRKLCTRPRTDENEAKLRRSTMVFLD